jgi:hypothetical protein
MKTSELQGNALNWAVHVALHGECEGYAEHEYSSDWAQGGPIIEREKLDLWWCEGNGFYTASSSGGKEVEDGPTPLIAAMRCYVASKLGETVEIPRELIE